MEIWQETVEAFRKDLPAAFIAMGGVSPLPSRGLSARLTVGEWSDALQKEIFSAIVQEIGWELFIGLVNDARNNASVVQSFDTMEVDTMLDYAVAVWDAAVSMHRQSIIIVSPTHLTIMQAAIDSPFERLPDSSISPKEHVVNPITHVGMLKGHPVYCNAFSDDRDATIVCAPGWFSYEAGNTLSAKKIEDLTSGETEVHFATDTKLVVDRSKVKAVSIEPSGIRFY